MGKANHSNSSKKSNTDSSLQKLLTRFNQDLTRIQRTGRSNYRSRTYESEIQGVYLTETVYKPDSN